jgi:hypothetical protein
MRTYGIATRTPVAGYARVARNRYRAHPRSTATSAKPAAFSRRPSESVVAEGDHVLRWIDAEHRAARDPRGNLRRNLPVAAADVQDAFAPLER